MNKRIDMSLASWVARICVVLFLFWLFCFGGLIAGIAFHDSDTCWLLSLGRWFIEHRALPTIDPFSSGVSTYDSIIPGAPLVQYQWLAEILFYSVYKLAALPGLIILVSCAAYIAFVCLPYLFLRKSNCPQLLSFLLIVCATGLAAQRIFVRPHTMTFPFLAALIYLYVPSKYSLSKISFSLILTVAMIMLLWTNTHLLFPLGVIFIGMVIVSGFLEARFLDRDSSFCFYQLLLPIFAIFATFINPWGPALWAYVERLRTAPNNYLMQEVVPLNLFDLHNSDSVFLLVLLITYLSLGWRYQLYSWRQTGILSPVLVISALFMSAQHNRLVPVSGLFMLAAIAELINRKGLQPIKDNRQIKNQELANSQSFLARVENHIHTLLPAPYLWLTSLGAIMLLGTIGVIIHFPPQLPQSSIAFQAPFAAIDFLKTHRPAGKVFNDPQFGSMMVWYLPNPDVFYDSRYSQYEPERILEYLKLINCQPGYKELWQKYNFDWAFVKSSIPLVKALRDMGWTTVYEDNSSVILVRGSQDYRRQAN